MKSKTTILILLIIPFAILACGGSDDDSPPIIHHVVTPESVDAPSNFPEVPQGFPADLKSIVVWLAPDYQEGDMPDHEIMYRVAIELWNQGERGFVNVVGDGLPLRKVYLLYPDVIYVTWADQPDELGPDGEPMKYLSSHTGTRDAVKFASDARGKLFTGAEVEEMMAGEGDYIAQYPGIKLIDFNKAGYKPKDVLVDYCNQPGNRTLHYCR